MKKLIFIICIFFSQFILANKHVYMLTWGSTQTKTGAGHSSIAFQDSLGIHYYSHYPKSVGGNLDTILNSMEELLKIDSALGIQLASAELVMDFEVTEVEFKKMKKVAKRKSTKAWTLFGLNCSDFVKQAFRKTKYDVGYAFLISTPYELVWDIRDHNVHAFRQGRIQTLKGFIHPYLKYQPRTVPYTLMKFFGLKK